MSYITNQQTRKRVDRLLQRNASIEAALGIDSTAGERRTAKAKQRKNIEDIKAIDREFYNIVSIDK